MLKHALIIGGTGMLREVTIDLLNKFDKVSVIARTAEGFKNLAKDAARQSPRINKLQLDYSHYNELTIQLIKSIKDFGEISLVVSWIHSSAPLAPVLISKIINETSSDCNFYEVLGSSHLHPENEGENSKEKYNDFKNISYHRIILGFTIENGSSRWLTSQEISRGVIDAVENKDENHVIGTVEPWSSRP